MHIIRCEVSCKIGTWYFITHHSFNRPNWDSAKKLMVDTNFLKRLMTYDKEHTSEAILKKVRKYTTDKEFDPNVRRFFNYEIFTSVSDNRVFYVEYW